MSTRRRLPNRRQSYNYEFEHDGIVYVASASVYGINFKDPREVDWGEVFLSPAAGKNVDSKIGQLASDSAVLVSLALQYGTPLNTLRKALCRDSTLDSGESPEAGLPEMITYSGPIGVMLDQMAKWRDQWLKEASKEN